LIDVGNGFLIIGCVIKIAVELLFDVAVFIENMFNHLTVVKMLLAERR
jgi:hypothetical protein